MITSVGQSILSKYLVGQTTSYASYIAIGGGAVPLKANDTLGNYSSQTSLNMEMLRVPIISKSYITEQIVSVFGGIGTISGSGPYTATITGMTNATNFVVGQTITATAGTGNFGSGIMTVASIVSASSITVSSTATFSSGTVNNITTYIPKIIFTAELPTQERYAFTEIGIFPSQSNSLTTSDSRNIVGFTTDEGWTSQTGSGSVSLQTITTGSGSITGTWSNGASVFSTNSDLAYPTRLQKFEGFRYLTNKILIPNNFSTITGTTLLSSSSNYLQLSSQSVDLSKNSATDKLILGLSIFSTSATNTSDLSAGSKVIISFESSKISNNIAQFQATLPTGTGQRYFVISKTLSQLVYSSGFSWTAVDTIKVFANASFADSSTFYIGLDLLRFENVADTVANPLYGLTGYTVVKNSLDTSNVNATPIIKLANNSNFIEFKFITAVS
jgi:hypothetical protein